MPKLILISVAVALLAGCSSPKTIMPFDARAEFGDLLSPKFVLVDARARSIADVRALLVILSKAKKEETALHSQITRLEFVSATEAKVRFLWSGGRHAGGYTFKKKGRTWIIVDDYFTAMLSKSPNQRTTDNDGSAPNRV